ASRSSTRCRRLSDSRAATTAPADPAPETIKSNVSLPSLVLIRPPICALDLGPSTTPCVCASAIGANVRSRPRGPQRRLDTKSLRLSQMAQLQEGPRFKIERRQLLFTS